MKSGAVVSLIAQSMQLRSQQRRSPLWCTTAGLRCLARLLLLLLLLLLPRRRHKRPVLMQTDEV